MSGVWNRIFSPSKKYESQDKIVIASRMISEIESEVKKKASEKEVISKLEKLRSLLRTM